MPEFVLDTSGTVDRLYQSATTREFAQWVKHPKPIQWVDLDTFTQGYIEAAFFTSCDPSASMAEIEPDHEFIDGSIPSDAGFSDLHPESLARIIADCAAFQCDYVTQLAAVYDLPPGRYGKGATIDARRAGQFFWYARNGHGVTWHDDFSREESGSAVLRGLQEASRQMPERSMTWGSAADGAASPTGYGFVFVE